MQSLQDRGGLQNAAFCRKPLRRPGGQKDRRAEGPLRPCSGSFIPDRMRDELLGKLLPLLVKATPGDLAAIHRFLTRQPLPGPQQAGPGPAPGREARLSRAGTRARSAHVFRRKGRLWEVIFADGQSFYLQDTLGARYLSHLLHEPNKAISAFDLEVAIEPEEGKARLRN